MADGDVAEEDARGTFFQGLAEPLEIICSKVTAVLPDRENRLNGQNINFFLQPTVHV